MEGIHVFSGVGRVALGAPADSSACAQDHAFNEQSGQNVGLTTRAATARHQSEHLRNVSGARMRLRGMSRTSTSK